MTHVSAVPSFTCTCPCGASEAQIAGRPLGRFFCHCTICQGLYQQPYADVTAFWGGAVELPASSRIEFRRYRPPPALRRGTCPACHAPVLGFLRLAPFVQLAFVPTRNLPESAALPAPAMHVFYHRHVSEVSDGLPKIAGYWPSELAVTRLVMSGLLRGPQAMTG